MAFQSAPPTSSVSSLGRDKQSVEMERTWLGLWPEVTDLTGSPEKLASGLDKQLKEVIATTSHSALRNAVLELCKQMPEASDFLSVLLIPPPAFSTRVEHTGVVQEKATKKRKRNICENCEGDADDNDGCCKWAMMQAAEIQEAKDLLGSDSEKGDGPRICDECGGDPDEGDGCCKWNMMRESKKYEARLFLSVCDKTRYESESESE